MGNSDDDSDLAEYGTALEPIEEDEVSKKRPIHVSEQIAVDEKGRRRFHGAFTGGFSAGYFNTVGSKEGWTPSTFKSSRADRSSFKSQNVLDFMDDEDKGAFGIAPQVLRPTDDFSDKSDSRGRKRPRPQHDEGPIPGAPALDQIIQPVKETVGIRILVKMGWRPGKGVGPKIDKRDKPKRAKISKVESVVAAADETLEADEEVVQTISDGAKFYGCSLPKEFVQRTQDSESETDEDVEEAKALLAPDDVNSILCNPKENTFGLGYKGLDRNTLTSASMHTDLFGSKLKFRVENKNLSITGQAFGVGAFEENDDDIYAREDMSQYDFALETPEERKQRKAREEQEKRKSRNKENCIDGFKIASTSYSKKKTYYPPPHLPPNYEPFHQTKKSRFEISKVSDEKQDALSKGLARHSLTISERQVLIEDDVTKIQPKTGTLDTAQKTVLSNEASAGQRLESNSNLSAKPTVDPDNDIQRRIERLKKFTQVLQAYSTKTPEESQSASFKPFMKNPEKQERYEKYLTLRDAGFSECLKDLQPVDMTEWERDREKMEFERASKLYKPMSSILAGRFVSAKSHDISHLEPEKEHIKEKDPKDDPKVAARMKLFGKLTHRIMEWHPDKLVCKRFNIPHPYPDSKFVGVKGDPSSWSSKAANDVAKSTQDVTIASTKPVEIPKKKGLFDNLDFSKPPPGLLPQEAGKASSFQCSPLDSSGEARVDVAEPAAPVLEFDKGKITTATDPTSSSVEEKEVAERPPLDLFKEIFADSSDSENEEDARLPTLSGISRTKATNDSRNLISQHMPGEKATRDDKAVDKMVSSNDDKNSLPPENESVNQQKKTRSRGVFDRIDLDRLQNNAPRLPGTDNNKSPHHPNNTTVSSDEDMEEVYGPAPPKNVSYVSAASRESRSSLSATNIVSAIPQSSSSIQARQISTFDEPKKEVNTEEVIWVEKSALSDGGSGSSKNHAKSRKHSSKKSRRKSNKKEKRKSHKSKQRHKHKKKAHKHKSKASKNRSSDESVSSESDDNSSDSSGSSDASITINDSLDNRALLAKLKQITKSN